MFGTLVKTEGDKASRYVWLRGGPHNREMADLPEGRTQLVRNTKQGKAEQAAYYRLVPGTMEMVFVRMLTREEAANWSQHRRIS